MASVSIWGAGVALMGVLLSTAEASLTAAQKCEGAKLNAAGKYDLCRLLAQAKAARSGGMPDFSTCDAKYSAKWAQAETKAGGMCSSSGDAATVQTFISQGTTALGVALAGKPLPACGNGVIDPGEQCDQSNLNGQTCASQRFAGGVLKCGAGCMFDTSGCSASRFVDNGDGTVTDHQTGLQWEKKDNLDGVDDDFDPHDADNVYTWCIGTFPDCTNLVTTDPPDGTAYWDFLGELNNGASTDGTAITGCFAGHCDWRLPTVAELQTILLAPYFCGTHPCIDPVFGPTQSNFYWSATADYPGPIAWTVSFDDGFLNGGLKFEPFFTRAVRGGS